MDPPSSILVRKSFTTLPAFATYIADSVFGKFLGNSGGTYDHYVKRGNNRSSLVGVDIVELTKKINDRITDSMQKYADDGTIYLVDLPDTTIPVMTAIFADIVNKKTADEIYSKYKQQLIALGVTPETLARLHGNILIVGSEGLGGTQEVYPENYYFGARALFGLGKIGINMVVNRATGKILAQSIIGEGGVEFMKYESRVVSGKVVFSDAAGKVIRLEQGLVGKWGFNYIFKTPKNTIGQMRIEQVIDGFINKPLTNHILGKGTIDSFVDFEKIIAYTIKNGTYQITENSKAEYILDFGGKLLKVVVDRTDGRLINISF